MATDQKVKAIVEKARRQFRSFGGGTAQPDNIIAMAMKNSPPQFAAGVDIEEVVRFVAQELDAEKRLEMGTAVKTTEPDVSQRKEWTEKAWTSRKWGVTGIVVDSSDSHGPCYEVRHSDGSTGWYNPNELMTIQQE